MHHACSTQKQSQQAAEPAEGKIETAASKSEQRHGMLSADIPLYISSPHTYTNLHQITANYIKLHQIIQRLLIDLICCIQYTLKADGLSCMHDYVLPGCHGLF
jgi:hypothetical protein